MSRATGSDGLPQAALIDFRVPVNPPTTVAPPVTGPSVAPPPAPVAPQPPVSIAPVVAAAAAGAPTPAVSAAASSSGGAFACIRARESGGNYATNTGNGYYGAYQFSLGTWRSVGGTGLPSQAPPAVQDALAQRLQQRSGWGQWSTHSMCGV